MEGARERDGWSLMCGPSSLHLLSGQTVIEAINKKEDLRGKILFAEGFIESEGSDGWQRSPLRT